MASGIKAPRNGRRVVNGGPAHHRPPSSAEEGGRGGRDAGAGRRCCGGEERLWIFLAVGAVVEVLGVTVGALYLHLRHVTTSLEHTQILPTYVPAAAILLTGLLVLSLFWKRLHFMVFLTSVISVGTGLLCGGTAALTGTHIIRPMMHFTQCLLSRDQCRCLSPYSRQQLSIDYSQQALTSYVYGGVEHCGVVQEDIFHVLWALCAAYGLVFLLCLMTAVLALLAYRTERLYKRSLQYESYEEIFTVTNTGTALATPRADSDPDPSAHLLRRTPSCRQGPRAEEEPPPAATSELIYSPSDIPLDYNEAVRIRQRSHSFSQPRPQHDSSYDSSDQAPLYASSTLGRGQGRRSERGEGESQDEGQGQRQGRLKEHRRRARRAVTLANLDHQQLMLIMSLQLRYLQESQSDWQFQANNAKLQSQSRRALTPTLGQQGGAQSYDDVDTRPVKLVRSHTPQPNPTYHNDPPATKSTPPTGHSTPPTGHSTPPTGHSAPPFTNLVMPFCASSRTKALNDNKVTEYENVDSCTSATRDAERKGQVDRNMVRDREGYNSSINSGQHSTRTDVNRLTGNGAKQKNLTADSTEESGYITMHGPATRVLRTSSILVAPLTSSNSYENLNGLASPALIRDPLYENQKESLAVRRQRDQTCPAWDSVSEHKGVTNSNTGSVPAQHCKGPASGQQAKRRASDQQASSGMPSDLVVQRRDGAGEYPARPKSYMSAVEGTSESSSCSEDSDGESKRHPVRLKPLGLRTAALQNMVPPVPSFRNQPGHAHSQSPLPDLPTQRPGFCASQSPLSPSNHLQQSRVAHHSQSPLPLMTSSAHHHHHSQSPVPHSGPSHGYSADSVASAPAMTTSDDFTYAQVWKKGRPLPLAPSDKGPLSTLPLLEETRASRSAFQKVSRMPSLLNQHAPCDTDLDDLDPVPVRRSGSSNRAPPYSSPPSYECLVASRQGSIQSLASTSSAATAPDDLDSADLYRQIRKVKRGSEGQAFPSNASASLYGRASNFVSNGGESSPRYPSGLNGHRGPGNRGQASGYYGHGERPGTHSLPFRRQHPSPVSLAQLQQQQPQRLFQPAPSPLYVNGPQAAFALPRRSPISSNLSTESTTSAPRSISSRQDSTTPASLARSYEELDDVFDPPAARDRVVRSMSSDGSNSGAYWPENSDVHCNIHTNGWPEGKTGGGSGARRPGIKGQEVGDREQVRSVTVGGAEWSVSCGNSFTSSNEADIDSSFMETII